MESSREMHFLRVTSCKNQGMAGFLHFLLTVQSSLSESQFKSPHVNANKTLSDPPLSRKASYVDRLTDVRVLFKRYFEHAHAHAGVISRFELV